jgi:Protein of unknown function (DUF3991)/Toprim-like
VRDFEAQADPRSVSLGTLRDRANQVRGIPLESVLRLCGAQPDRYDKFKWHTAVGTISVTGAKFINWNRGGGGGGAIDLVIHLHNLHFKEALDWLERQFPNPPLPEPSPARPALKIPPADPQKLWRVKGYLIHQRRLPAALLDPLIQSGLLYADARANAVFLLFGKENTPVGAELRGTTDRRWRGMAPGSRKDLGFFSIPSADAQAPKPIILCESVIDAISCFALSPDHRCISTSGARSNPQWLAPLVGQGIQIYCGFDSDIIGERAANAMISLYPTIQRLRPSRHDWNDVLTSQS